MTPNSGTVDRSGLFSTIGEVYRFIGVWRRDLFRLLWPFILLEFIYLWARFFAFGGPGREDVSLISFAYLFLALVTLVPLSARVLEFALAPGPVESWLEFASLPRNWLWAKTFTAWCLPLGLAVVSASALMMLVSNPAVHGLTTTNTAIALALTAIMSVLIVRLILVFPLAFDTGKVALARAWGLSKGRYFFLFLLFTFSTVPFRLVYRLCEMIGEAVWANPDLAVATKLAFYFFVVFLPSTMALIVQFIVLIITVTFVYKDVTPSRP